MNLEERRAAVRQVLPRLILTTPEHLVAFGFGAGLSRIMPGTAGTLVGVLLWFVLAMLPPVGYAVAVVLLVLFGIWICGTSARLLAVHDHPGIVFDEIVGFQIACAPVLPALAWTPGPMWAWLPAAFVLFRVFDIVKPWPIKQLDRRVGGGWGIVLDDLLAGFYAAVPLTLIAWLLQ